MDWEEENLAQIMYNATEHGRIENAQWLREQGATWVGINIAWAALHHQVSFIAWAIKEGCEWNWMPGSCRDLRHDAAAVDTFAWLHMQENFPCNCDEEPSGGSEASGDEEEEG
jgi:hypothetical protein